ncbi:MAG: hypothetical protein IKF01_02115 [Bacilli bacterium]|nr:hypothetical protein [Bacilli bacterium]
MKPKDYYGSYYKNNEKRQDERLENNMHAIKSMFKEDPLEKTQDIKKVELLELKELLAKRYDERQKDDNSSQEKGKVLKKSLPGYKSDAEQILTSFISCFLLALVTAFIGTGWLIYIINHI